MIPPGYDVIVIGAGAAGLMCAIEAGRRGRRVLVIEHADRPGKKLLISGGGRCNFTNLHSGPANFLSANSQFCVSALARYTPFDFVAMVERHGIAYHEKEAGQLFCDLASRLIVRMLLDECDAAGVRIALNTPVAAVQQAGHAFVLRTELGAIETESLVVATGGLSIPAMGATGFGHDLARQFGHHLIAPRAALVPLTLSPQQLDHYADLSGLSLPVQVRSGSGSFRGGLLFTHRGLSGPAILQVSSYWQPGQHLAIDWLPDQDIVESLQRAQQRRPAAALVTVLGDLVPKRLAQQLCEPGQARRPMRSLRTPELAAMAAGFHDWWLIPAGTEGYRTAEVTLGGVNTTELSSKTMESRLVPGLYFIGEVVDVTGHLGGHNLQWAWASGVAAGQAA